VLVLFFLVRRSEGKILEPTTPFRFKNALTYFICRGSIGRVKLAVHKETGFKVAIKIVDKEKITEVNPHLLQKIEREIVLMVRITIV
jgi:serine/threonine protein kinase